MLDDAYTRRVSWQALAGGATVISADGTHVGTVERVVAHSRTSTFAGVIIAIRPGLGGLRFVDPAQIALIEGASC